MKKIDWKEIQIYYDNNHTWSDIIKEFKIANNTINRAIRKGELKLRTKSDANKLGHIKKPRKLTEETKKKISESRKKYLKENPDKVPYLLNHSQKESYPEKYFQTILKKSGLKYKRFLQISYYNIDFAFIDKGIDLEIDGDQHIVDQKVVKSNIERDKFLTNNGWKIIRILWSDYKRLKDEQKTEFIDNLLNHIKNSENDLSIMIDNKNYCECGKEIHKRSKKCNRCESIRRRTKKQSWPSGQATAS